MTLCKISFKLLYDFQKLLFAFYTILWILAIMNLNPEPILNKDLDITEIHCCRDDIRKPYLNSIYER